METTDKFFQRPAVSPFAGEKSNILVQAFWIVVFTALTALGAQIAIPHQPVPYTLQTFFVLLGAAFLGSRNGSLSQLLYLGIGLAGAPVFSGGQFWSCPNGRTIGRVPAKFSGRVAFGRISRPSPYRIFVDAGCNVLRACCGFYDAAQRFWIFSISTTSKSRLSADF